MDPSSREVARWWSFGRQGRVNDTCSQTLATRTGLSAPTVRLPHWIPLAAAAVTTGIAHVTRRPPRVSLESVRMSTHRMFFDASRAVRELGLPQTPVEQPLSRAVAWFREHGYVRP